MVINGTNLCDFCFEVTEPDKPCEKCGFTHENYNVEPGVLPPGTNLIGKYILGKGLGRGGFGATYMAYSNEIKNVVAIKEYFPINTVYRQSGEESVTIVSEDKREIFEKGAKSFFDEAKTISRFNKNKNIVSVYEFFYANNTVYYAMEYLRGTDLKRYVAQHGGKLSEAETVRIIKGICNALMIVHSTQTLHRDIAPDNIFICQDSTVKLIDFGASKHIVNDSEQNGAVVVKQGFAPAEQYTGKGRQGVWTDIYAVGATMYYCLTGKVPSDAMERVENPTLTFNGRTSLSAEVRTVVERCMETKIENRYQSVLEMLDGLAKVNLPDTQKKPTAPGGATDGDMNVTKAITQPASKPKSKKIAILVASIVALTVAVVGVMAFTGNNKEKEEEDVVSINGGGGGGGGGGGEVPTGDEPAGTQPEDQTPTQPEDQPPTQTKPEDQTPTQTKPAEKPPTQTKPAEKTPAQTKPAEKTPAEKTPAEKPPAQSGGSCPVCGSTSHTTHPTEAPPPPPSF